VASVNNDSSNNTRTYISHATCQKFKTSYTLTDLIFIMTLLIKEYYYYYATNGEIKAQRQGDFTT
jgi:hypothetical protein